MQSGCRWVYTLRDWDTGEIVAQGTSVELAAQGYFPSPDKLSSAKEARAEQKKAEGLTPDQTAENRMMRVYSCYDADGVLLGKGTAAELKEKGVFGSEGTVHECYRKRGGVYKPGGVVRMEMELCKRRVRHPKKLEAPPKPVKRKPIGGVVNPSALAYDVHDLMEYNERARKLGLPELTYGYWAAKGKPATP